MVKWLNTGDWMDEQDKIFKICLNILSTLGAISLKSVCLKKTKNYLKNKRTQKYTITKQNVERILR